MRLLPIALACLVPSATRVEDIPLRDLMAISNLLSDIPLHVLGELPSAIGVGMPPPEALPRRTLIRFIVRRQRRPSAAMVAPRPACPACPCEDPIRQFCRDVVVAGEGPFAVAACLQKQGDAVPEQCRAMLADTLVGACANDAAEKCPDVELGGSAMHKCLASHVADLSTPCKAYFEKAVRVWPPKQAADEPASPEEEKLVKAKVAAIHHVVSQDQAEKVATERVAAEAPTQDTVDVSTAPQEEKETKRHHLTSHIFSTPVVAAGVAIVGVPVLVLLAVLAVIRYRAAARLEEEQSENYRLMMT